MLTLKNVRKSYREPDGNRLPILDLEKLDIAAGEQVVLVGESGGGKTTLLHLIAGILLPDEGQIEIGGTDITRLSEAARDRFRAAYIGYVFQTFNLLAGFSALENVLLGMAFTKRGADISRAKDLLDRVGLSHRATHRPGMLSVGEQQRVAVARALASHPKIVLADEPTANVDRGHQQQIVELMVSACRQDETALLLVTHTPEVAEQFSRVEPLDQINRVAAGAA